LAINIPYTLFVSTAE